MIACTSSPGRLFAAPFAIVGSISVVGERINIQQGWGVKPMVFRGGKDKAPLTLFGEVTKEGIEKVQLTMTLTSTIDTDPKPNLSTFLSMVPYLSGCKGFLKRLQKVISCLVGDIFRH
jgi:hypothetical protein